MFHFKKRSFLKSLFWFGTGVFLSILMAGQALSHTKNASHAKLPKRFQAPELTGLSNWINSSGYQSMKDLKGKVVLIDFWTFGCINCIHTLPYVQKWHQRYEKSGLVVLGIHAPEFEYERKLDNVQRAVRKYGITYPVAIDNGFKLWREYKNRFWPALYLVDAQGVVRYMHFGEGRYQATEAAIQQLLEEAYERS